MTLPDLPEGFIRHDGGPCPVYNRQAWIEPEFRGPEDPAKGVRRAFGRAWQFVWEHDGEDDDIIGWRIAEND